MAHISGNPTMPSEQGNLGAMMIGQSDKEPLIKEVKQEEVCEEQYQKNLEAEEEHRNQLSQCFMNQASPSESPSLGTTLTCGETNGKRSKLMTEDSCKRPTAYYTCVVEKAMTLQASLDPQHPSFVKFLLRSHVTLGFLLALPMDFCRMYLPNHDHTIKLEGDDGVQYETKFLADKGGLGGGWRGFSLAHNLQEGDVVVFHLVRQYEFKVYIVRANSLDHCAGERQLETAVKDVEVCRVELTSCVEENCEKDGQQETDYELEGEGICSESSKEDCSSPRSFVDLKNFSIIVHGCPIDSQLSWSARVKYYELCCAQKSYLHGRLLRSINHNLAAEIILGTVNIADAIRACSLSTSQTDLKEWDKTLEGFKHLGMDVDFLLERMKELLRLSIQYQECNEAKRYFEVINEGNHLNEKIASLETKLIGLKEAKINLQIERENLEAHFWKCNSTFQNMAKTSWSSLEGFLYTSP